MSSESISFYDEQGRITATLTSDPATVQLNREHADKPFVEGDYFGQPVYVAGGVVLAQPDNPAHLDGTVLRDLPVPCTITVNGVAYECLEDSAELAFIHPGTYTVQVQAWPHLDKEFSLVQDPA